MTVSVHPLNRCATKPIPLIFQASLLKFTCAGFRHIDHGLLPKFAESCVVKTYTSGERRIAQIPPKEVLEAAFLELGTHKGVATAFGVSRQTVERWAKILGVRVESHPGAPLASAMKKRLDNDVFKSKVAQWLMDEGSVSVAYVAKGDYTLLLVCGSMNDHAVPGLLTPPFHRRRRLGQLLFP